MSIFKKNPIFNIVKLKELWLLDVVYDDLLQPATLAKQGILSKPDFDYTNLGLLFPQNDNTEIAYYIAQFNHKRKNGTNIYPHIHYWQAESDHPVWKMDYRWVENGGDPTIDFTTIVATTHAFTYVSDTLLQVSAWPAIDGSSINSVSSILDIKLYRDDNLVTGDVLEKSFDMHYQIDALGSRQEWIK